jgi:hypothetical protein
MDASPAPDTFRRPLAQWTLARVKAECAVAAGLDPKEELSLWDVFKGALTACLDDDMARTAEDAHITDGNGLLLQKPVRAALGRSCVDKC